jgi:phosphoadenosine phosphosulfate reductase
MAYAEKLALTRQRLADIASSHPDAVLAHSLGAEDMVLLDLIAAANLPITAFSLDTGRLPAETYTLLDALKTHYPTHPVQVFFPDAAQVEALVANEGMNGFYRSVEARKACCGVRKMQPLKRALAGRSAWITGLRREQSPTRQTVSDQEWDADNGLVKYNPLIEWSEAEVWLYLRDHAVPYNALHDQHFPSIGCAPCTRAISVGEYVRAGRWWWENPESKECGLHVQSSTLKPPAVEPR